MEKKENLEKFAKEIRCLLSEMFLKRGDGHIGGSFSIVEVLAVLFGSYIEHNDEEKDWFVLSKGHAGPAYYATLSLLGYIGEKDIFTLNENGTILPSHPDRNKTPGVDCTTGSLGQGISQAVGIAYGLKVQGKAGHVYCIVGDGECNEGEVWEAFQFASNKKLSNLTIFIDYNEKQVDGMVSDVSIQLDFQRLMDVLGYHCQSVDGHNIEAITKAVENTLQENERAKAIVLHTKKGFGIPYFEQQANCHHVTFSEEQRAILVEAITNMKKELRE